MLIESRGVLDFFRGCQAAPAAYQALTYIDAFRQHQVPWLLALLLLNIPMFIAVIVMGRWSATLRRIDTGLSLLACAALAWMVLNGPVFMIPVSDGAAGFVVVLIIAFTLIAMAIRLHRKVKPAPN